MEKRLDTGFINEFAYLNIFILFFLMESKNLYNNFVQKNERVFYTSNQFLPMETPSLKKHFSVSIQAHRGYSAKYPENTLLAFEKAIEAHADYIELDVHASSDGHIVVIHDDSTGRVSTKNVKVDQTTLQDLKEVSLGENQTIPTLREVFELCKGKIGINIEIKQKNITTQVNDLILEFNMAQEVVISSFDHEELVKFKKINPNLVFLTLEPRGGTMIKYILNMFNKRKFIQNSLDVGAQGVNPHYRYITPQFCTNCHANGLIVNPWTIDDPKLWEKLIHAGVDSIITNNPVELSNYLSSQKK